MKKTGFKDIHLLLLISFLGQFSMAVINLGLIFYTREKFGLSPQAIGLLTSLAPVTYFAGLILLKQVVAKNSPAVTVITAAGGMTITGTLITTMRSAWPVFILYAVYGGFMALFWPTIMGWISRGREGKALGRRVSHFNFSWSGGLILGPYAAGILTEAGTGLAIWGAGAAMAAIVILAAGAMRLPGVGSAASGSRHILDAGTADRSTSLRFICWIGIFTGYFVFGITMNIFPLYAKDILSYSEGSIGLLLLVRALVTTLIFVLLGNLDFWHFKLRYIVGFQLLLAVSLAYGTAAKGTVELLFFFILFGVAFAGIYTNSIFHGAAGSINREFRMALHEAFLTAGLIAGSLSGGILYQRTSFSTVLLMSLAVTIAVALIQVLLYLSFNRTRRIVSQP